MPNVPTGNIAGPDNTALPDVGELVYNGVEFDCLYASTLSGRPVPDAAGRTAKFVEWTLAVDGVVTLLDGKLEVADIELRMNDIRRLLEQPGGHLIFRNKGLGDLTVNRPGISNKPGGVFNVRDVAWGPKPAVLDFKPLGGGHAALIKWQCITTVPVDLSVNKGPFLQFNEEIAISYDEEGYSQLSIRGTMEIPLTRKSVNDATLSETVDTYRRKYMDRVGSAINSLIYRVTQRTFTVSRDRRTMEWQFTAVELPPMPPPADCMVARGTFSVRPQKQDSALMPWICSLRRSYVVRADRPRRTAWWAFISLLKFRMEQSALATVPVIGGKKPADQGNPPKVPLPGSGIIPALTGLFSWKKALDKEAKSIKETGPVRNTLLIYFGFDEGLYLDSRTMSFEASWILIARFADILVASGVWRVPDQVLAPLYWSSSVNDIQGSRSWLDNAIDPKSDVIVDYNLGTP